MDASGRRYRSRLIRVDRLVVKKFWKYRRPLQVVSEWLRGAVTGAVEDAEVGTPRTDGVAVLVSHDAGDLVQMRHVMSDPSRQKLRQSDGAEGRMASAAVEVCWLQIQCAQLVQVF